MHVRYIASQRGSEGQLAEGRNVKGQIASQSHHFHYQSLLFHRQPQIFNKYQIINSHSRTYPFKCRKKGVFIHTIPKLRALYTVCPHFKLLHFLKLKGTTPPAHLLL